MLPLHQRGSKFPRLGSNKDLRSQNPPACRLADEGVEAGGVEPPSVAYRATALNRCATPPCFVRGAGVEPASAACRAAAQPLYQPRGRGRGSRTRNLLLPKQTACRQAFTPSFTILIHCIIFACQMRLPVLMSIVNVPFGSRSTGRRLFDAAETYA